MEKDIPQAVREAAEWHIKNYGNRLEYLGKYKGQETYMFAFPEDQELGFPCVFVYDNKKVTEINGFDSLDIINHAMKDV